MSTESCLPSGLVLPGRSCHLRLRMIVRSFEKCGISVAPDGSEDENNIIGLEDYSVESDDDEDPFSDEDEGEGEENEDDEGDEDP